MPLLKPSGSLLPTSIRTNKREITTDRLVPNPALPLVDDRDIAQITPYRDTFHNRTSFNAERFPEIMDTIIGYVEGSPILVTYYSRDIEDLNFRSHDTDFDITRDTTHHNFIKILNFEIRLQSQISHSYNQESGMHEGSGEAILYPGVEPYIGDVFIYELFEHQLALFAVTNKEPLSISQASCFKISFELKTFIGQSDIENLNRQVIEEAVFVKEKGLTTKHALLNHKSYSILQELKDLKVGISKRYHKLFFNEVMQTYLRPDGIYDPYLVKYLLRKITIKDVPTRPLLLKTHLPEFEESIWGILLDENNGYSLDEVYRNCYSETLKVDVYRTDINPLINKQYIVLTHNKPMVDDEDSDQQITCCMKNNYSISATPYIFREQFYTSIKTSMYETLIRSVIQNKSFDILKILDMIKNYKSLSNMDQFYLMPIYIHLIEKCIDKI